MGKLFPDPSSVELAYRDKATSSKVSLNDNNHKIFVCYMCWRWEELTNYL